MRSLLLVLISFLFAEQSYSATISTTVDRSPVYLDTSFEITFEADANPDGDPDFSPLEKDMQLLNQHRSSNMSIINGVFKRSQKWVLTVIAKKTGLLRIPAINFGSDQSKAVTIEVVAARDSASGKDDVFIELDIDNDKPYVQAQVLCTVRLYLAASFRSASLSEPQSDAGAAIIKKVGEDKKYQSQRGQRSYQVVERQYAIYPQKSGVMTIAPILFQGQTGGGGFFSSPFQSAKTVVKRSDSIVLDIRPIPAGFPGQHWLPASNVNLAETWSTDPMRLQQGEPVTRTLTLTAQGLLASQLPVMSIDLGAPLNSYPEQPTLSDTSGIYGFLGAHTQRMAVVPARADTFDLLAIRIPWWNTATDALAYAELPARKIKVAPTTVVTAALDPLLQQAESHPVTDNTMPDTPKTFWKEAFFISLFIWLVSILLLMLKKRTIRSSSKTVLQQEDKRSAINTVYRACKENDPRAASQALLHWGRLYWPQDPAASLEEISRRCGIELGRSIMQLDRLRYSKKQADWDGAILASAFTRYLKKDKQVCSSDAVTLEPLHYL